MSRLRFFVPGFFVPGAFPERSFLAWGLMGFAFNPSISASWLPRVKAYIARPE